MDSVHLLLVGFGGSISRTATMGAKALTMAGVTVTHLEFSTDPEVLAELTQALGSADAVFIQGIHEPHEVDPLLRILSSNGISSLSAADAAAPNGLTTGLATPDHPTADASAPAHHVQVLACGVPCATELVDLSFADAPSSISRLRAALRQLTPAGLIHAGKLAAHIVAPDSFPDPGSLADSKPHGLVHLDAAPAPTSESTPVIGIAVSPFQVSAGDLAVAKEIAAACTRHGACPVVWAGDPSVAPHQPGSAPAPRVDAWLNLTGFTLAGTHANPRVEEGVGFLTENDVPLFTPIPMQRTPISTWEDSMTGLTAGQVSMNIAIPEFESGLAPWVIGGRDESDSMAAIPELCDMAVERAVRTVALRRKEKEERKVSITIFGHDFDGTIGTASHLDVFHSLWNFLRHLAAEGYLVEVPESPEALVDAILADGEGARAACSVAAAYPAAEYREALTETHVARIDKLWSRVPGMIDTDGRDLFIRGIRLGNVFIGVQPDFGDVADPLNVLMAPEASPSHSFAAYYLWLEHVFGHDVMLHWGTHGALEFMPGRSTGLLPEDWPMLLTGSVPHSYLYAMSNPAEGTIAKRRSAAGLVSYLTPQLTDAGLPGALRLVAEEVMRLQASAQAGGPGGASESTPGGGRESTQDQQFSGAQECAELITLCQEADLTELPPPAPEASPKEWLDWVQQVSATVERIRCTPIPEGLHILGQPIAPEKTHRMLTLAATYPTDSSEPLAELWPEDKVNALVDTIIAGRGINHPDDVTRHWYRHLARIHQLLVDSSELEGLSASLNGNYVPPAPGGEPASHPAALPTGRNTHGADPGTMPTPTATRRGAATAEALLANLAADGKFPESVAIVIWGMDNVKTQGEGIAQAFRLIGAEPHTDARGRVSRYTIIPLEELGRPRVDVVCTMSGVGRDLLGGPMELLDEAIHEVAQLDEPLDRNFVRAHALAHAEETGTDIEQAATRIFAMAPGLYGSGVNKLIQAGQWDEDGDLAEVYLHRMGHAWGAHAKGEGAHAALKSALSTVTATFQNVDSTEISLAGVDHYFEFLGGVTSVVETLTGQAPRARVSHAWQHKTNVESLADAMRVESRTRLLNPTWYEAQLKHGYQGVAMVRTRLENTFGMQATTKSIDGWVFTRAAETFLLDDTLRERMADVNPAAVKSMADRLIEAYDRELWDADESMIDQLEELSDHLDAQLEGVE